MVRYEELFGGSQDGSRVQLDNEITRYIAQSGELYTRRRDGRLYHERCQWDEDSNQWSRG